MFSSTFTSDTERTNYKIRTISARYLSYSNQEHHEIVFSNGRKISRLGNIKRRFRHFQAAYLLDIRRRHGVTLVTRTIQTFDIQL